MHALCWQQQQKGELAGAAARTREQRLWIVDLLQHSRSRHDSGKYHNRILWGAPAFVYFVRVCEAIHFITDTHFLFGVCVDDFDEREQRTKCILLHAANARRPRPHIHGGGVFVVVRAPLTNEPRVWVGLGWFLDVFVRLRAIHSLSGGLVRADAALLCTHRWMLYIYIYV